MTSERRFDDGLEAWLEEGPAVAPLDLLEAVLREFPATRQRGVVGSWGSPWLRLAAFGLTAAAAVLAAIVVVRLVPTDAGTNGPQATPGWADRFPQQVASTFARPFTYAIDPASRLTLASSRPDHEMYQFRVPAPGEPKAQPANFVSSVFVRTTGDGLRVDACGQTGGQVIGHPTPEQFFDYLSSVPGLILDHAGTAEIDGLAARTIDVRLDPNRSCKELWIFESTCNCPFADASSDDRVRRILALDVDGETILIIMSAEGGDLQGWLPTARAFAESIHFR